LALVTANALLIKKDFYRIWYEFYQIACASPHYEIKELIKSSASKYALWGKPDDIVGLKFDKWWSIHSHLFTEVTVKKIASESERQTRESLLIEVPLNESTRNLTQKVKSIIDGELAKRSSTKRKRKTVLTSEFRLSENAEPKIRVLREILNIYKNVYLKNPRLRGQQMLEAVHSYYLNRQRKKDIPVAIARKDTPAEIALSLRNLRRYIASAKSITVNVAMGEFPGKY